MKLFQLLTRHADISHEAHVRRWEDEGVALIRRCVPADLVDRCVLDTTLELGGRSIPQGGVVSFVVPDRDGLERWHAWYSSVQAEPLRRLEEHVTEPSATVVVPTRERILGGADRLCKDGRRREQPGAVKVMAFLRRHPRLTTAEFARYWEEQHAPLALDIVPVEVFGYGYVQNHAVPVDDGDPPYDGVAEMYFDDLDHMRRWSQWFYGDEGEPLRTDEYRFMVPEQRTILVTEEHLVIP